MTLRTIELRSRRYRNTVVVLTALALAISALSAILWSWIPLLALTSLVPASGTLLLRDSASLRSWQHRILALWSREGLPLGIFLAAIRSHPGIPQQTLEGMLTLLPPGEDLSVPDQRPGNERLALVTDLERGTRREHLRTAIAVAALSLFVACAALSLLLGLPALVLGAAPCLIAWVLTLSSRPGGRRRDERR